MMSALLTFTSGGLLSEAGEPVSWLDALTLIFVTAAILGAVAVVVSMAVIGSRADVSAAGSNERKSPRKVYRSALAKLGPPGPEAPESSDSEQKQAGSEA